MKSLKHIALGSFLALSTFGVTLYSSCSKDKCKDVVCQNGGTCAEGICTCATGYTGTNCETIYRTSFANTYKGTGSDNGGFTYTDFRMKFESTGSDVTKMSLTILDNTGASAGVPVLTIDLSNFSSTGASFTVESATQTVSGVTYTYTGTGTINGTTASLSLTEKPATGAATIYTFNNFTKQ